jgi:plasmid stability protein
MLQIMKATLDLPDELYRRVKARSAMEGRPVRAVAMQLFQNWLEAPAVSMDVAVAPDLTQTAKGAALPSTRFDNAPWLSIARKYVKSGMEHDMGKIRDAISTGWSEEIAGKLNRP